MGIGEAYIGRQLLLRAAIPLAGRSFPVYESVHEREGCPKYKKRLLQTLAETLPKDCVPILVADAGFRRPWIKAVEAQGWYYVARVRNRDLYWQRFEHLAAVEKNCTLWRLLHRGRWARSK